MTELRSKKENEGQLKSKSMIENNLQSASVVPNLQLAAGHHKERLDKHENHKEHLQISMSSLKMINKIPNGTWIPRLRQKQNNFPPQYHPSSPCPCSSRVGSGHFQFRKACPAPPSSPPSDPRWTGEEKSKMSCKKTREQQGAEQGKGSKEGGETRTRAKLAMLPVVFTTRRFALDWRGKF